MMPCSNCQSRNTVCLGVVKDVEGLVLFQCKECSNKWEQPHAPLS
jgi:hypothetical protein